MREENKRVYLTEKEVKHYVASIPLPEEDNPLYEDIGNTQYFLLEHCSMDNLEQFEATFNIFLILIKEIKHNNYDFKITNDENILDKHFENLMYESESEEYCPFDIEDLEYEIYRDSLLENR